MYTESETIGTLTCDSCGYSVSKPYEKFSTLLEHKWGAFSYFSGDILVNSHLCPDCLRRVKSYINEWEEK